jgi:CHAD domain-containing protein
VEAKSSFERELKLEAPLGFRLPGLGSLASGLSVTPPRLRPQRAVYWDTRDLRLTRWDCGLRHRDVDGWTLKLPARSEGPEVVRRELRFEGPPERPPAAAQDLVMGMTRREPLVPVAELRTAREQVCVVDAEGRVLVEVTNDLVESLQGGAVERRFREVEVEFAEACPRDVVQQIAERLARAGTGPAHRVAKQVRALGLDAGVAAEIEVPEPGADASLAEVLRRALARSTLAVIRHDVGLRADESVRDVHQMRVATRRLRAHLGTFRRCFDAQRATALRAELRWLGREIGRVRDPDVLAQRLRAAADELPEPEARGAKDLLDQLADTRRREVERLRASLRSPRYVALVDQLVEAARAPALRVDPATPAKQALRPLLSKSWKRLRKRVAKLDSDPAPVDLHPVRIRAKHVRYAAEVVTPLYGDAARRLARATRRVQQVLGELQDTVVARDWLQRAASTLPRETAASAGLLASVEQRAGERALHDWPEAWEQAREARRAFRDATR